MPAAARRPLSQDEVRRVRIRDLFDRLAEPLRGRHTGSPRFLALGLRHAASPGNKILTGFVLANYYQNTRYKLDHARYHQHLRSISHRHPRHDAHRGRPGRTSTVRTPPRAQVSAAHRQKVLQRLVHAGLARSTRGPKGGYALARSAASIRLGEVFQAIEGALPSGVCLLDKDRCCMGTCALGDMLHSVSAAVAERMRTKLSDLVRTPVGTARGSRKQGWISKKRRALI